jgi:uncharacterized protein YegP (UPF0339 family)
MKKLLALSTAAVIFTATVNAQADVASIKKNEANLKQQESVIKKEKKTERKELRKLSGKEVSEFSRQAFITDFGNIPVNKWERTVNYDEATFTKDGVEMKAYYDADSKLVGTTSHKTFADIPAKAQKFIEAKYRGYSKTDVVFFDDNELNETDMVMYGNQFDDADNYFVDLKKDNKEIILQVTMSGEVSFFKQIK